ncbi:hypothetical protein D9619_003866 [Psilocybe cf. subviscida]|uniref:Uncharacterized protein n=1 Tax=Psilocybe cf. subviscida TaxID=2480587 RepID=A0A8H5ETI8_9AGAR|nr:hypothetical protein D9619_003866 [Psilocybe cf. subviscida]
MPFHTGDSDLRTSADFHNTGDHEHENDFDASQDLDGTVLTFDDDDDGDPNMAHDHAFDAHHPHPTANNHNDRHNHSHSGTHPLPPPPLYLPGHGDGHGGYDDHGQVGGTRSTRSTRAGGGPGGSRRKTNAATTSASAPLRRSGRNRKGGRGHVDMDDEREDEWDEEEEEADDGEYAPSSSFRPGRTSHREQLSISNDRVSSIRDTDTHASYTSRGNRSSNKRARRNSESPASNESPTSTSRPEQLFLPSQQPPPPPPPVINSYNGGTGRYVTRRQAAQFQQHQQDLYQGYGPSPSASSAPQYFGGDGMSMGMDGSHAGGEREARPGIFDAFLEADEISRRGGGNGGGVGMSSMDWQRQGDMGHVDFSTHATESGPQVWLDPALESAAVPVPAAGPLQNHSTHDGLNQAMNAGSTATGDHVADADAPVPTPARDANVASTLSINDPAGASAAEVPADVEMKDAPKMDADGVGHGVSAVENVKTNGAPGAVAITAGEAPPPLSTSIASSTSDVVVTPTSGVASVPEDDDDAMEGDEDAEGEEE